MSGTTLLNLETALNSLGRSAASGPVTLGTVVLTGMEVPSLLRVGGDQTLVIHKLVGGDRVIQSMGNDPMSLTLAGLFTGPTAQQRAQSVADLRNAGNEVKFGVAGLLLRVRIQTFAYTYQEKGAVIPYELVLEVQPTPATTATASTASLSALVGPDIAGGIAAVSNGLTQAATFASNVVGQAQTVIGQVTPIANLVGAGGLLAHANDHLTAASTLASAGTNFAAAPAAAASVITDLQSAGTALNSTIAQAGANIAGIQAAAGAGNIAADMTALAALHANMGAQVAAVQAGGQVNRALVNTQLASGQTPTAGLVHS